MNRDPYDVAVVGGGPAGAAAASALARAGRRVLVVERERFPRFHIGESLLPLSRPVFDAIGIGDKLESEKFTHKWGSTFLTADGEVDYRVDFRHSGRPTGHAYHVLRSRFDEILLRHAAECGAEVREGCRATGVEFGDDAARLELDGGERVAAHRVIDASGRRGFLARTLGLRESDAALRKVAVFRHFRGVPACAGEDAGGDIRLVSRPDLVWIWMIPLAGGAMSIGAVFDHARHEAGSDPAAVLDRILAETPVAAALMRDAEPMGEARFEGDFSYTVSAYAGDRWLLAGDAGSFIDPVFSTGVHLALHSGLDAARAVLADSPRAIRRYDREQRRRYRFWRRFVAGFYEPGFRDLLFKADAPGPIYRAVVSVLAGDDSPSWWTRVRIGVFLALARLQRRVTLVPRIHPGES